MKLAIRTGFVAGLICFLIGQFAAVPIVNIFGDFPEEVKELAVRGIRLFFIAYLVMGVNFVLMTYFQSIGEVAIATWITAGRQIILMLLFLLIVPFLLGVHAIWLAIPFAEITVLILIYVYLKRSNIHFGEKRVF